MASIERLHWRLIVDGAWSPEIADLSSRPIPKELSGLDRIAFYKARTEAQRRIDAMFPPDESEEA